VITSAQNSKVRLVRELIESKKARGETGMYIIEGVRMAEEALTSGVNFQFAFFSNQLSERGQKIIQTLIARNIEVEEITPGLMNRISDTQTSQGILTAIMNSKIVMGDSLNFILALDQVRDPGNAGTLLRSAAAVGIQAVLLTAGNADVYSPKVLRSGMGAHFKLKISTMSAEEIYTFCKSINKPPLRIILADSERGKICWEEDLTSPLCLVIGGEAAGVEDNFRKIIDASVRIPMLENSDSYNAAVAGSILMYETFRQRTIQ
jgi:TrmH family RNA methyltransferase